ncbi:MAG TPA: DEAD/DEAH box helicase [Candidatus Thermoplasmatota archaeon]|nr:DEAD/DEAH box helicase [Candidatus Thermoplasmatota archaeon]
MSDFDDLPITERAREAAHALGWREPTPIQAAVLPQLAAGRDVIGRAETGSGKTGAFGLFLTDAVADGGLKALVLAPTRELVVQIARDLNALGRGSPFRAVAAYGGVPHEDQLAALTDPATTCAVATTGRLLDLLEKRPRLLESVRFLVLDEADRMLDLGFLPDVERILRFIPGERQTALFTATMPKKVTDLARKYMSHPREVGVGAATPESATHHRIDVSSVHKHQALLALLAAERPERALVFARTREGAHDVARRLRESGIAAVSFAGDLDQAARDRVVAGFASGAHALVVATDVAARGLDIPGITHVVNFDAPEEADAYVHRAGRTARAGRAGRVFTLVGENDGARIVAAEREARVRLLPYRLPADDNAPPMRAAAPPKPVRRGGNAAGTARRRAPQAPANPLKREAKDVRKKGPEHSLPRSRRRDVDEDAES